MIWLTWRQYRVEMMLTVLAFALLCVFFIKDGLFLYGGGCRAASCLYTTLALTSPAMIAFLLNPLCCLLASVFVGAPMVAREQEARMHYLLWTQGITRRHWLAAKLSLITIATLLVSLAIVVLMTWWWEPLNRFAGPWDMYHVRGLVMPASILFMLLLGVAIGTFVRQTILAMALTFLVVIALLVVQYSFDFYLIPPVSKTVIIQTAADFAHDNVFIGENSRVLYSETFDSSGHKIDRLGAYCGIPDDKLKNYDDRQDSKNTKVGNTCTKESHIQWQLTYQPANRFWVLQGIEAALLLLLTLGLVFLIFWQLGKRRD